MEEKEVSKGTPEGIQDETFKRILGENIRKLRKIHGLTQVQLGHMLGYKSSGALSQIEKGDRGMDHDIIYKAAKALNVPPAILFSQTEWSDEQLEMAIAFMDVLKKGENHKLYDTLRSLLKLK